MEKEKLILPFERSYWVISGKLLAGEIPSSSKRSVRKQKVQNLAEMGFDTIINLMEPDEKTFSGELLVDYTSDLQDYAKRIEKKVTVCHFPIKDLSTTTAEKMKQIITQIFNEIQAGKKVYVHCWGGIGRTGLVIGCFLLEQKRATKENVIETIAYLKRTTSIASRRSPETDEQMDFILDWPLLRSKL